MRCHCATSAWSLRSDSNGRPSPYRGDALTAGATKACAGCPGLEPGKSQLQGLPGLPIPPPPTGAACRPRTCRLEGTSFALSPDELTRHEYARRDLNPHPPGSRPGPSTFLRHERTEPLDRLERSPPGYDAGTLPGELQRHELPIVDSNHEPSSPGPDAATN